MLRSILHPFQLDITKKLTTAPGKVLHAPAIVYKSNHKVEPKGAQLDWRVTGREQFIATGQLNSWVFVIVNRCVDEQSAK